MTRAEIIASIPVDIPDEVVARELGTGVGYVRQIRRHGVAAMREASRGHSARYRERNLVRVRKMQRDWERQKKLRTFVVKPIDVEAAWEALTREQDRNFIRHMRRVYPDLYTGDWFV